MRRHPPTGVQSIFPHLNGAEDDDGVSGRPGASACRAVALSTATFALRLLRESHDRRRGADDGVGTTSSRYGPNLTVPFFFSFFQIYLRH